MASEAHMRTPGREETDNILRLLDLAFAPSSFESILVRGLITDAPTIHHWVLEQDGELLAYVCYSIAYRGEQSIGWHLAPVAVHPDWQRRGHGSSLIRQTLALPPLSDSPVFVLGNPEFYARFGFRQVREPRCPFDPENAHFMAMRHSCDEHFIIGYEKAFGGVSL